jgi:hypothetical protein
MARMFEFDYGRVIGVTIGFQIFFENIVAHDSRIVNHVDRPVWSQLPISSVSFREEFLDATILVQPWRSDASVRWSWINRSFFCTIFSRHGR